MIFEKTCGILKEKNEKQGKEERGDKMERREIYLAGGCFWGVEAYYQKVRGILDTETGYANGNKEQTSYRQLSQSGHAETVKLVYDVHQISLAEIVDRYLRVIDPFSLNRQGNDVGTQYRTGIYYVREEDRRVAEAFLSYVERTEGRKTVVELEELRHFIPAENIHQDYLRKHPEGYCHIGLSEAQTPLYPGEEVPSRTELRQKLSREAYEVTQEAATEKPGSSCYLHHTQEGIYVDIVTGQPLFSTADQFDAGCGWPSFTRGITTDAMEYRGDFSFGMQRTEVKSREGGSHLGHVFEDGPQKEGGLRYCINGAALRFIPKERMKEEGYERLLPYV